MLFNIQKDTAQGRCCCEHVTQDWTLISASPELLQGWAAAWAQAHADPLLLGSWAGPEKPAALAAVTLPYSLFQHEVFLLF